MSARHELNSGDLVEIAHGAESIAITVRHVDGAVSAAHLTPAEAMTVGAALWGRGLTLAFADTFERVSEALRANENTA